MSENTNEVNNAEIVKAVQQVIEGKRKKKTKEEKAALKASKPPITTLADIKSLNDIKLTFILGYVKAQGQADIDWLKQLAAKPVEPDKNGKERKISFIEIRKEFARKYLPHLVTDKDKKPSMIDLINDL